MPECREPDSYFRVSGLPQGLNAASGEHAEEKIRDLRERARYTRELAKQQVGTRPMEQQAARLE
jgi:hypothetical protein